MTSVQNAHKTTARLAAKTEAPCLTPPHRLVAALRDNPLALGLLCLIARLYLIHKQPVPLSAADIAAYDPLASPSAIRRALKRLVAAGGAIVQKHRGAKQRYAPAWGLVNGVPRPWRLERKLYDRPAHLAVLRFDVRIFDYFLGRILLDGRLSASVERYVSAPLLSLSDVGACLALQGGWPIKPEQMSRLARCGLIRDDKPCDLPQHGDDILRWISQRQLFWNDAPVLAEKGLRRLGLAHDERPSEPPAGGQPIVYFAPGQLPKSLPATPERSGCSCGNPSGLGDEKTHNRTGYLSALGEDNSQPLPDPADMTGNLKQLTHDPTLPSQEAGFKQKKFNQAQRRPRRPLPATPTAQLLQSLGARSSVIRELCHIDIEQADKIVAYGRSRPDVRSLAGWVVSALRDHRDTGWLPPPPSSPNSELFDPVKFAASPNAGFFTRDEALVPNDAPSDGAEPALRYQAPADVLMGWLRATFNRMLRREDRGLVASLQLLDAGDAPVFGCACAEELLRIEGGLAYCIKNICEEFGWEQSPRFVLTADWPGSAPN